MQMIDVYSSAGTLADKRKLAQDLAKAVMTWEKVPPINLFTKNTAAFVHDLPAETISNAAGESNYVRVQVLTPVGVLDRDKQLGVVRDLTDCCCRWKRSDAAEPHLGVDYRIARGWELLGTQTPVQISSLRPRLRSRFKVRRQACDLRMSKETCNRTQFAP